MISNTQESNYKFLIHDLGEDMLGYLNDKLITEIMLNDDGSLWIEKHGHKMLQVGNMRPEKATMIINTMATSLGKIINAQNPILGGEIPIDGSRFQAMIPPVVTSPCFAIRKKAIMVYSLEDYIEFDIVTKKQAEIFSKLVEERKNILIVGSTASGKTTFANAILKEISRIDPHCRMVIIEDTWELQCDISNKLMSRTSDNVTIQDLLKSMLRFRPDRICVGEIRGIEAYSLLMAWNTGHSGGITTVHANHARAGIKRIEQILISHNLTPVPAMISEAINVVISIQKTLEGRKIKEILELSSEDGRYFFKELN